MSSISTSKSAERAIRIKLIEQLGYLGQMQSTETAHFHQIAASLNGMNITDSKTMSVLIQEGSMTAGQLATRLSLTTGAVTSVIDRLEAGGFAHRVSDLNDRRKVIVQADHKKLALVGKTYDSMGEAFTKLLQAYSTDQLEFMVDFFKAAIKLSIQETAKLQKNGRP